MYVCMYVCLLLIVLEALGGGTLSDVIDRAQGTLLPHGRALDIAYQLISALHYIHEDLSPYAMMIHRGTVSAYISTYT